MCGKIQVMGCHWHPEGMANLPTTQFWQVKQFLLCGLLRDLHWPNFQPSKPQLYTFFGGPSWLSNEKSENQFRVGLYGVVGYRKNCQLDQTNSRCCITMKVPLAGGFEHVESMWSEQDYTKYIPQQQNHENHHSSCKGSVVE